MSSIILASESFLKNFIFEKSKLPYTKVPAEIDESEFDSLPVEDRVVKLAEKKCRVVAEQHPDAVVVSADTLTVDDTGKVYSKLTDEDAVIQSALAHSGKTIAVHTGCTVYHQTTGYVSKLVSSAITYQSFSEVTLRRLIDGDNFNIRSGALGIFFDSPGFTLIDHVDGSFTGSFGLPMEFVYAQFDKIGLK